MSVTSPGKGFRKGKQLHEMPFLELKKGRLNETTISSIFRTDCGHGGGDDVRDGINGDRSGFHGV